MGVFTSPKQRLPYVPPLGRDSSGSADASSSPTTMLGSAPPAENDWLSRLAPTPPGGREPDSNIVLASDPDPASPVDDVQIAQRPPTTSPRSPAKPSAPPLAPEQSMGQPGRGNGDVPQAMIESGMSADQKRINRAQALYELARRAPVQNAYLLADDWQRTKPSEVVDDIKRAAQRHGVPTDLLARLLYQEGKFNESHNLPDGKPLVMQSNDRAKALGWAQITTEKIDILKNMARARGDTDRLAELNSYSPADRAKAFDVAAELLAYQHRLLGSWHASVAAYNIGDNFVNDWLKGLDRSADGKFSRDPNDKRLQSYWRTMKAYLPIVLRGASQDLQTADMYEPGNARAGFRVAPPVNRLPNAADPWRISQDAKENPYKLY